MCNLRVDSSYLYVVVAHCNLDGVYSACRFVIPVRSCCRVCIHDDVFRVPPISFRGHLDQATTRALKAKNGVKRKSYQKDASLQS